MTFRRTVLSIWGILIITAKNYYLYNTLYSKLTSLLTLLSPSLPWVLPNTVSLLTPLPPFSHVRTFKFHSNINELSIVENKQYSIKNIVCMTSSNLCVSEVSFHDQRETLDNYRGGQHTWAGYLGHHSQLLSAWLCLELGCHRDDQGKWGPKSRTLTQW